MLTGRTARLSASTLVPSSIQTDGTAETAVEGRENRRGTTANTRTTTSTRSCFSGLQNDLCAVVEAILTVVIFIIVIVSLFRAFSFGYHSNPYLGKQPYGTGRDHPRDFKDGHGCLEKLVCRESLDLYHRTTSLPYCQDRQQFLEAMGEGERSGLDAPYYPKGLASLQLDISVT